MKPGLLMLPSAVSDSRVHNILPNKIETDFQFSRASSATRVNHQGLIENVGYFSDELVQNGDFSELGPELVTNGDFSNGTTGWTANSCTLSVVHNTLKVTSTAGFGNAEQNITVVSGKTYKVSADFIYGGSVEGRLNAYDGSASPVEVAASDDTSLSFYITISAGQTNLRIRTVNQSSSTGVYNNWDNVSVKQVDPNDRWELGTDWSYGNNKVIGNGTQAEVTQQNVDLTDLKKFKVTFTIEDYVSGDVRIRFRGGTTVNGTPRSGNGTYTEILTSTGHTNVKIDGGTAFTGSVTNISIVEVQGDKPRLDYDPTNPTCPHLLLEPQSTNLVTFSEDISQWGKSNTGGTNPTTATSNQAVSPDGTLNASKVNYSLNSSYGYVYFSFTSNAKTLSVYVKYIDLQWILIYASGVNGGRYIDIKNRTTGGHIGNSYTFTIEDAGNDWSRITMFGPSVSLTSFELYAANDTGTSYTGVTTSGSFYMWGAQGETTAYATSYIPTAGAAETRVAETCTNAGNADTFNSTEGVLYAEIASLTTEGTGGTRLSVSDGSQDNNVTIGYSASNTVRIIIRSSASNQALITSAQTITDFLKIAVKYKANDFALYINGSLVGTDTSGSAPSGMNNVSFNRGDGTLDWYGKVKGLATYNRALTDTELYTITSTQYSAYSGMVAALGNYTIPC